jgi:hypothetical protein
MLPPQSLTTSPQRLVASDPLSSHLGRTCDAKDLQSGRWREMIFYYNTHLDWFHRWLGGEAAPWDVRELARNRAVLMKDDGEKEAPKREEGPGQ